MALALVAIGAKLVDLQGVNGTRFARLAYDQRVHTVTLPAVRGSIFDDEGHDLALSVPQNSIYADPTEVTDPAGEAALLAPVLAVPAATLEADMRSPGVSFVYLERLVSDAVSARVRALSLPGSGGAALPGIGLVPEMNRFYPAGTLAAPVLGSVGRDGTGLGGLEAQYNGILSGTAGATVVQLDPKGREIPSTTRQVRDARRGQDLVLTLDQSLQYEVEQALATEVGASRAKGGMAIVMDARTGDIRAMATIDGPSGATPVHPATADDRNQPVTSVYEPGSTNKVITISAAIQQGLVSPSTVLTVPQSIDVGGTMYADVDPHGLHMTVADVLAQSSNVGTIEIAKMLGPQRLDAALHAFGLGSRTALDFPGESAGILLPLSQYNGTSMGSIPVGNGIAVTALQMLGAYATVANGGVALPPRLVAATIDADGHRHDVPSLHGTRVVSAQTAAEVTTMLEGVVQSGTGTAAAITGYHVAGKTGTARIPPYAYPPYNYMASFAGFAPADAPRLLGIVVMDEPQGEIYGGSVSAPVFAQVIQDALRQDRVAPTSGLDAPMPAADGEKVSNDVQGLVAAQARTASPSSGTASRAPAHTPGSLGSSSSPSG